MLMMMRRPEFLMMRRPEFLMMRRPEFLMCAALRHPAPPYKRGPNGTYYTTRVKRLAFWVSTWFPLALV
jgi:hypothetical protein